MNLEEVTFIFTVGGDSSHYENMSRCMRSINKFYNGCKFLVLEFGNKLVSSSNIRVCNITDAIDFTSGKRFGYIIWKHKYVGALMVDTKYGVYVDTDTVMANQTLEILLDSLSGGVGAALHFWVPSIGIYQNRACSADTVQEFLSVKSKLKLEDSSLFFAGGVFLFERNDKTTRVFQRVLEMYSDYYDGRDYVKSITDELFLAAALNEQKDLIRIFGGALNHCSMGDENMPLSLHEGKLFGRNSFESNLQPVTFLHCDVSRRDPSEHYTGETKDAIRKIFEIES